MTGEHGAAAPVALLEAEMTAGPFTNEAGAAVSVSGAACAGEGEPATTGYTHVRCNLTFADGTSDEVIVHLLAGNQLFFKSARG